MTRTTHEKKINGSMNKNSDEKIELKIMIMVFAAGFFLYFIDIFIFEGNKYSVLHTAHCTVYA